MSVTVTIVVPDYRQLVRTRIAAEVDGRRALTGNVTQREKARAHLGAGALDALRATGAP